MEQGYYMITSEAIQKRHQILFYELKPGTKSSFYLTAGAKEILPERLSFIPYSGIDGIRKAFVQIDGKYKKNEKGLYYSMNRQIIHSKIMPARNFPMFIGWGEIDERFRIYDLLILYSCNNCQQSFEIHHFRGLAKPEYLEAVCQYLQSFLMTKAS